MRQARLATLAPAALERSTIRLDTSTTRLLERARNATEREQNRLDVLTARLGAVDPAVQLARGWTITRDADGRIVRHAADLAPGQRVTTDFLDGRATSTIDAVDSHPIPEPAPAADDHTESDPHA